MYSDWINKKLEVINEESPLPDIDDTSNSKNSYSSLSVNKSHTSPLNVSSTPLPPKQPKRRQKPIAANGENSGPNLGLSTSVNPEVNYAVNQTDKLKGALPTNNSTQVAHSEDDQIRNNVVEKVLANEKQLLKKMPHYNPEELLHTYMQTAIVAPQHDNDY
jgi:hypothetical protein